MGFLTHGFADDVMFSIHVMVRTAAASLPRLAILLQHHCIVFTAVIQVISANADGSRDAASRPVDHIAHCTQ